jgi:hypothetical protein
MPTKIDRSGETHAIFAVDPGRTTGIAAAYVTLAGTLKETLLASKRKKSLEVEGDWDQQAKLIADLMNRFTYTANVEAGMSFQQIHFVFENFQLRTQNADLTPVWIAAGAVMAYGSLADIKWQEPSHAKSFATNSRLKLWGLYVVGSEHERDAWRHLALRANEVVG